MEILTWGISLGCCCCQCIFLRGHYVSLVLVLLHVPSSPAKAITASVYNSTDIKLNLWKQEFKIRGKSCCWIIKKHLHLHVFVITQLPFPKLPYRLVEKQADKWILTCFFSLLQLQVHQWRTVLWPPWWAVWWRPHCSLHPAIHRWLLAVWQGSPTTGIQLFRNSCTLTLNSIYS